MNAIHLSGICKFNCRNWYNITLFLIERIQREVIEIMTNLSKLKERLDLAKENASLLTEELNEAFIKLPTSLKKPGPFEEKLQNQKSQEILRSK